MTVCFLCFRPRSCIGCGTCSFCLGLVSCWINGLQVHRGTSCASEQVELKQSECASGRLCLPLWHWCAVNLVHESTHLRFLKGRDQTSFRASGFSVCHSCILCTPCIYLFFCFACIFVLLELIIYICLKYFSKYSVEVDAALNSVKSGSSSLISRTAERSGTWIW